MREPMRFRFPPELVLRLRRLAQVRGVTMTRIVEDALRDLPEPVVEYGRAAGVRYS